MYQIRKPTLLSSFQRVTLTHVAMGFAMCICLYVAMDVSPAYFFWYFIGNLSLALFQLFHIRSDVKTNGTELRELRGSTPTYGIDLTWLSYRDEYNGHSHRQSEVQLFDENLACLRTRGREHRNASSESCFGGVTDVN